MQIRGKIFSAVMSTCFWGLKRYSAYEDGLKEPSELRDDSEGRYSERDMK